MNYIFFPSQILRPTLKSKLWLTTQFKTKKFGMGGGTVFLGRTHGCERQKVSSLSKTYPNAFQNLAWLKIKFQEDNATTPILVNIWSTFGIQIPTSV